MLAPASYGDVSPIASFFQIDDGDYQLPRCCGNDKPYTVHFPDSFFDGCIYSFQLQ